jgi:hypothetical protein
MGLMEMMGMGIVGIVGRRVERGGLRSWCSKRNWKWGVSKGIGVR